MDEAQYRNLMARIAATDEVVNSLAAFVFGEHTAPPSLFVAKLEKAAESPGQRLALSDAEAEERAEVVSIAQGLVAERAKHFRYMFGLPSA